MRTALDGKVGGLCVHRRQRAGLRRFSHGQARTSANAPAHMFLPSTKIPVASVSKVVTALAAIRVLAKNNYQPRQPASAGTCRATGTSTPTSRRSRSGNCSRTEAASRTTATTARTTRRSRRSSRSRSITTKHTTCQGSGVVRSAESDQPNDKSPCYSNYNFSIFRVLLPMDRRIRGRSGEPRGETRGRVRQARREARLRAGRRDGRRRQAARHRAAGQRLRVLVQISRGRRAGTTGATTRWGRARPAGISRSTTSPRFSTASTRTTGRS